MKLSGFDASSTTYEFDNQVCHEIKLTDSQDLRDFVVGQNFAKLIEIGLVFPTSKIDDINEDGYKLLRVFQDKETIIYPAEWTLQTLKETALAYIQLNNKLNDLGFWLKDAHPYNFIISSNSPRWVDIGSITKKKFQQQISMAELEFLQCYILPLHLASKGFNSLARIILSLERHQDLMQHESILLLNSENRIFSILFKTRFGRRLINLLWANELNPPTCLLKSKYIKYLYIALAVKFRELRIRKYVKFLNNFKSSNTNQLWVNYDEAFRETSRFEYLGNLILKIKPNSLVDLGGNSGEFLRYLASKSALPQNSLVLDFSEDSLDIGIKLNIDKNLPIKYVLFNAANPWVSANSENYSTRFNSELVLALAITHHLALTEMMSFDQIANLLSSLTRMDLLVEYMPKGLVHFENQNIKLPTWYTLENFKLAFDEQFELISEVALESNRYLLHFRKKNQNFSQISD